MVGRTDAGTEKSKVSTAPRAAGLHTEAWGQQRPLGVPAIRDRTLHRS